MAQIAVFLFITLVAAVVVFFGGIGMLAYTLPKSMAKFGAAPKVSPYPTTPPLPTDRWTFMYSGRMIGDPADFTFPNFDGVHYCMKGAAGSGIALGKTIKFVCELSGDGALVVADPNDTLPATVRLILQRNGDNLTQIDYRYWFDTFIELVNGRLELSAPIDATRWTNVNGQRNAAGFQALLNDLMNFGFTFGGKSFAGHGVYCPAGVRTLKLIEYSVA